MAEFELVSSDRAQARVRHIAERHEYVFEFVQSNGEPWHEPHLVAHTEGDGSTGTGLAGEHLEEARAFAAQVHAGGLEA